MFFKRRLHTLPKFPPQIIPMFKSLCIDIPLEQLTELRGEFDQVWQKKMEEARGNIGYNKNIADKLYGACKLLLDAYEEIPAKNRRLAVGAIRYCVATEDAYSDELFAAGQHDDVQVINFVLEELGFLDSFIEE